jgi:hypothetical protein
MIGYPICLLYFEFIKYSPVNNPTGSNYVQASAASRSKTSVFRFVIEVLRGFEGRFR